MHTVRTLSLVVFLSLFVVTPLSAGEKKSISKEVTGIDLQPAIEYIRGKTTAGQEKVIRLVYPQFTHPARGREKRMKRALSVKALLGLSPEEIAHSPEAMERIDTITSKIVFNDGHILDVAFFLLEKGQVDAVRKDVVLNVRTGRKVELTDLFLKGSLIALRKKVDAAMQKDIENSLKAGGMLRGEIADFIKGLHFQAEDLKNFSISSEGVSFYFDFHFPLKFHQFRPCGAYFFSFQELEAYISARGLLASRLKVHS